MKLGLLGTTILYASRDNGVGGEYTTFPVNFLASYLYVTIIGATILPSGGTYKSKEVAVNTGLIISGGGFSNY